MFDDILFGLPNYFATPYFWITTILSLAIVRYIAKRIQ